MVGVGPYTLLALAAAFQAWRRIRQGDRARSAGTRLALPLTAWLSLDAMQRACREDWAVASQTGKMLVAAGCVRGRGG
ncbi:hypothetical protein [Mesorhizobium sp. ORS 3428]|uniref:hypothetical protein n=1 Tax=Mesorhizobium sp. ORS 3428 TaxID=540997 RepID=UPI0008D9E2B5|nr:hypothetical protein [Mesorhizobium sp. ORS 3428]OHV86915.1 hypothetical protein ORS3428_07005 [Mesorhizobium sp. ORS 3428]